VGVLVSQVRVLLVTKEAVPPRTQLTWCYAADFDDDVELMDHDPPSQDPPSQGQDQPPPPPSLHPPPPLPC
jgi:hypothetical protein